MQIFDSIPLNYLVVGLLEFELKEMGSIIHQLGSFDWLRWQNIKPQKERIREGEEQKRP